MPNRAPALTPAILDRNLALECARVTEASAVAAARLMGRGDEKAADEAACAAMRDALNGLLMNGVVVNGEGDDSDQPLHSGERIGRGWRETVRRKIGKLETCTHLAELLGPAVTTLFQTMSNGKTPDGGDSLDNHAGTSQPPFFINGCHSWRTDGPVVAKVFPQFATKPRGAG